MRNTRQKRQYRESGFVLVLISSDSDFTRLASRIREQGLDVYGIGEKKTPAAFVQACKRFIYVENLTSSEPQIISAENREAPVKSKAENVSIDQSDPTKLIQRAMDAINTDGDWYTLGQIGQFITRANPDFDTRSYGKKKLSDLIKDLSGFEMRTSDNHLQIRRIK